MSDFGNYRFVNCSTLRQVHSLDVVVCAFPPVLFHTTEDVAEIPVAVTIPIDKITIRCSLVATPAVVLAGILVGAGCIRERFPCDFVNFCDFCGPDGSTIADIVGEDVRAGTFPAGRIRVTKNGRNKPVKIGAVPEIPRTVQSAGVVTTVTFTCLDVVTCRIGRQGAGDAYLTALA